MAELFDQKDDQGPFSSLQIDRILPKLLAKTCGFLPCRTIPSCSFQSGWIGRQRMISLSPAYALTAGKFVPESFFALKGACADGHSFLNEAAQKGAAAAVVSKSYCGSQSKMPLIYVEDPLESLQLLAKKFLEQWHPKIVAVTGSVGKTTTKDFITVLLRSKYQVASSPGNSNSQIGLPLALLNHTIGNEEILVLEMGMTHKGHIAGLVKIAPPDIALITTVALVHACNFNSLTEIGNAKAEIFSHPKTYLGIVDRNAVNYQEICSVGICKKISFGLNNPDAHYNLQVDGSKMRVHAPDGEAMIDRLPLPGSHNHHNYLAAIAVARSLGLSWDEIRHAAPHLNLPERRLQFVEKNGAFFVNDSYNASMVSLKSALENLPSPRRGCKTIAVIGEMMELGQFSEYCHREVGDCALQYVDCMFCFGEGCMTIRDCWQAAGKPVEWHMERSGILEKLRNSINPGDVVLLKGSRSKEVWKVLEEL